MDNKTQWVWYSILSTTVNEAQVLIDFVIECTISDNNSEDESNDKLKQVENLEADLTSVWVLYIDGASNVQDSAADLIFTNFEGIVTDRKSVV